MGNNTVQMLFLCFETYFIPVNQYARYTEYVYEKDKSLNTSRTKQNFKNQTRLDHILLFSTGKIHQNI